MLVGLTRTESTRRRNFAFSRTGRCPTLGRHPALRATLSCRGARGKKAQKGAKFRGNKATIWFRMSKLTQKRRKNKANRPTLAKEIAAGYPANPKNKANF